MTGKNQKADRGAQIEKAADDLIRDFVDDGFSLGEIWSICQKVIEKLDKKP